MSEYPRVAPELSGRRRPLPETTFAVADSSRHPVLDSTSSDEESARNRARYLNRFARAHKISHLHASATRRGTEWLVIVARREAGK